MQSIPRGEVPAEARSSMVRMRDGTRLATDVYIPSGASGRLPSILTRVPYDKTGTYIFTPRIAEFFTAHGYVFVAQDTRGRTRSEGVTFPWVSEFCDGYDTLDWIVDQKWSNGVIGMCGDSYYGFTQWAAAATRHPSLRAIAPRVTSASHLTTLSPDEQIVALARIPWFALVGIDNGMYEVDFDWSIRPIRDAFAEATGGRRSPGFEALLAHPIGDPWWMRSMYGMRSPYAVVDIPVLHWGGWWDSAKYGQFRDYRRMMSRSDVAHQQFLIADATDHEGFEWSSDRQESATLPGNLVSPDWHVDEVLAKLEIGLPFYDRYLRGRDASLPRVKWMLTGAGWRESETWPPPKAHVELLHLAQAEAALRSIEGGALASRPDRAAAAVRWTHDPDNLVPDPIADTWEALALGLPDESSVEGRGDVATFTSEPLSVPLRAAGPVQLVVECSAGSRSLHLFGKLNDVCPDGRAIRVAQGGLEVHQADYGYPVTVDLGDIGYQFDPGHCLRLEVASSCYPRFLWHPGSDQSAWDAEVGVPQAYSLHVGGEAQGCLRMSVV